LGFFKFFLKHLFFFEEYFKRGGHIHIRKNKGRSAFLQKKRGRFKERIGIWTDTIGQKSFADTASGGRRYTASG
jgi:hypothetical protein